MSFDLIVVGSGLAGLYGSMLAARYGDVLLLSKSELPDCNTAHAQGGIAAALLPDDSPGLHYRDTLIAADGLANPRAVRALVEEGPARVRDLIGLGVPFDRDGAELHFTREGAHSRARVLHAGGDASGARIEATMVDRIRSSPRITIRENHDVFALTQRDGRVVGVRALDVATGEVREFRGAGVLLATGGAGQVYAQTTNPAVATGDGIAVAFRAGAAVADLEFVQFHPTALAVPGGPRFLISEAVRGEGGILRNARGERFMPRYDERAELAPRDVVARAIVFEMQRIDAPVYLDVAHLGGEHLRRRFPTIARVCAEHGVDVGRDPIPVAPAAHYLMGGIVTDTHGATTLPGLYAAGECGCTGIHGANRLASNSLLETIVFSARAVERHFGLGSPADTLPVDPADELNPTRTVRLARARFSDAPARDRELLRELAWRHAGLIRDASGLRQLSTLAEAWLARPARLRSRADLELENLILLARLSTFAALVREESRGAHYRTDFPSKDPAWRRQITITAEAPTQLEVRATGPRPVEYSVVS